MLPANEAEETSMPDGATQPQAVTAVHTTDVLVLGAGSAGCVIAARL